MITRRMLTTLLLLASLLGTFGCKFTKKKPSIPPQAQAPTTSKSASTQPGPTPPATMEPSRPLPTPGEVASDDESIKPAPKPKPRVTRKTVQPGPAEPQKKTTVVQNGSAPTQPTGPLTASISHDDALHQKLDTAQLIEATESNLRSVNRTLNPGETAMVQHIRSYIKDSQNATNTGDFERAYNLALKAHLLSDELAKK